LADALTDKADTDRFDGSMLAEFNKLLGRVFTHAVDSFEICCTGRGSPDPARMQDCQVSSHPPTRFLT
jgi:hypothetical protein